MTYACEQLEFIAKRLEELEKEKLERIQAAPLEDKPAEPEANTAPHTGGFPIAWPYAYPGYP